MARIDRLRPEVVNQPRLFGDTAALFASANRAAVVRPVGDAGIQVDLDEVVNTLGYIPPALAGTLAWRNFDLVNHHRRIVLKRARDSWPGRKQAMRMIASGLHRYGSKRPDPTSIADVVGESFAAADSGNFYGEGFFRLVEEGGTVSTGAPMAIPVGAAKLTGGPRAAALKRFHQQLENGELVMVGRGRKYLIHRKAAEAKNARVTRIVAVLARSRVQRPLLRFDALFREILPKHVALYERDLGLALNVAGQRALANTLAKTRAAGAAYAATFRAQRDRGVPIAEAKKAAKAAGAEARKTALSGGKGGDNP